MNILGIGIAANEKPFFLQRLEKILAGGWLAFIEPEGITMEKVQRAGLVIVNSDDPQNTLGILVCIRRHSASVPIIVISRDRGSQAIALTTAADDYIIKPFGYELFVAKVEAVLRRYVDKRPK